MIKFGILAFILIILFSSCVLSYNLGVSPPEINLKGDTDEKLCTNFSVISKDFSGEIINEVRWAGEGIVGREQKNYNLSSSDREIESDFDESFFMSNRTKISICFTAHNAGIYRGLLLFRTVDGNVEVGSWVVLGIGSIKNWWGDLENTDYNKIIIYELGISSLIYLFILGYFFRVLVRKDKLRTKFEEAIE